MDHDVNKGKGQKRKQLFLLKIFLIKCLIALSFTATLN